MTTRDETAAPRATAAHARSTASRAVPTASYSHGVRHVASGRTETGRGSAARRG